MIRSVEGDVWQDQAGPFRRALLDLMGETQPSLPQADENRLVQRIARLAGAPETPRSLRIHGDGIHGNTTRLVICKDNERRCGWFPYGDD